MTTLRTSTRIAALAGVAALTLAACGDAADDTTDGASPAADGEVTTIVVGASPTPHAEILEFVQDNLAEDAGFTLDIVEYTDYVQPNVQLAEGVLDANFFQHLPYFETEVAEKGYDFAHFPGVHIEPYGVYSESLTLLDELPTGAQIGVPNDPSNQARALQPAGSFVTLTDGLQRPSALHEARACGPFAGPGVIPRSHAAGATPPARCPLLSWAKANPGGISAGPSRPAGWRHPLWSSLYGSTCPRIPA